MKLMELHGHYFWISSAELRKEKPDREIKTKCRNLAWEISDLLRVLDENEFLEDILKITHSSNYKSAIARYEAMDDLLGKLGNKINPKYVKAIRQISKGNIKNLRIKGESNAPSSL